MTFAHPTADRLAAYGLGRLSDAESLQVEQHLADCDTCRTAIEATPDDPLARLVRQSLPKPTAAAASTRTAYQQLRFHAKGGLGEVSVARDEAVGREVAVKRLRPDVAADPARRRRFLREAVVTARLEHPGIAPVYGIGEDEHGEPCYAMRFVPGKTLLDAVRDLHAAGPVTAAGLRLLLARFTALCATVAYAHSRGVVHRDIKPANVAVGAFGETILLDWGLALEVRSVECGVRSEDEPPALDSAPRAPHSALTETGTVMGTPGYMAPEQGRGERVGPPADVYSLGATLRVILTGRGPAEPGPDAPVPALAAVADRATAADPTARYPDALALAADVELWLADEPVTAYPDPLAVRVRRFVRRHQTASAAAVVLLLASTVALGVGAALLGREQQKTADALGAESVQRAQAEAKEKETAAVLGFVDQRVFAAGRPKGRPGGLGRDVKLVEALKAAVPHVEAGFADQPLTAARLRLTLGTSFTYLGDSKSAEPLFASARQVYEAHHGPDHPDTLTAVSHLANAVRNQGRGAEALRLDEAVLAGRRAVLGPDHPDTLRALHSLANSYAAVGRDDDALRSDQLALVRRREVLGRSHPDTLASMNAVASSHAALDQNDAALKLREEALPLLKSVLGPDHPDTLIGMNNLANSYLTAGRPADALALWEQSVPLSRTVLGPDHPDTLTTTSNLARSYSAVGRRDDALRLHREVLDLRRTKLGADHPDTFITEYNIVAALLELGRGDEAVPLIDAVVRRAAGKPINPLLVQAILEKRARYFAGRRDVAGCRASAELWEERMPQTAAGMAEAAQIRAIAAGVPGNREDADRAMDWLRRAAAAGQTDLAKLTADKDFDALRDRADFRALLAETSRQTRIHPEN